MNLTKAQVKKFEKQFGVKTRRGYEVSLGIIPHNDLPPFTSKNKEYYGVIAVYDHTDVYAVLSIRETQASFLKELKG